MNHHIDCFFRFIQLESKPYLLEMGHHDRFVVRTIFSLACKSIKNSFSCCDECFSTIIRSTVKRPIAYTFRKSTFPSCFFWEENPQI